MKLVLIVALIAVAAVVATDTPSVQESPAMTADLRATTVRERRHRHGEGDDLSGSYVYKTVGQTELELFISYPPQWKATDKRAGIVFFFGGAWTDGTVREFRRQADDLAERGMVALRAEYRVASRDHVTPKECVEDAKSAVRWMRAHAAEMGIDPDRIVAAGGSAGGHIAACTALTPGLDAPDEDTRISSKPNVLVLYNPVLMFADDMFAWRVHYDRPLAEALSPTLMLKADSPPTLLIFGTEDYLFPQVGEFMARSRQLGHHAELYAAEGRPHGFYNRGKWTDLTTARVEEFLKSIGCLGDGGTQTLRERDMQGR